ncbi:hypothetical protein T8J41_12300 [Nitratireductor rhodophyticola]|uniref:Uncharacterized protein n=1 Tax=Nitratireductor aquibiodomus RA22 TaxID=1189611 RepID=I5C4V7_9HYPH|nr:MULTISPECIES: hypothetical protein [Nitratireductor]EIM76859.1 hypothetical protein A33O_04598 [Nitratireductor aquibiodomus RA22]MEC9245040.1 hypothetical protein [Pseudomonadota bacterium]WPZ12959.1 hypothetical protein T8J41_12300 [Nitratireductor rhodophyticola]
MFQKLKIATLSAMIGLGTLAAAPATAQADSLYFGFGIGGPSGGYVYGNSGRSHRAERPRRHYRACSPRQAVRKAERMGLRRARVVRANRNIIRVAGRTHWGRQHVVFARAPRCPVIR